MKNRKKLAIIAITLILLTLALYFAKAPHTPHPVDTTPYTDKEKVNDVITIIQELDQKPKK